MSRNSSATSESGPGSLARAPALSRKPPVSARNPICVIEIGIPSSANSTSPGGDCSISSPETGRMVRVLSTRSNAACTFGTGPPFARPGMPTSTF